MAVTIDREDQRPGRLKVPFMKSQGTLTHLWNSYNSVFTQIYFPCCGGHFTRGPKAIDSKRACIWK